MANKRAKPKKEIGGPYLAAALFCDSIINDQDTTVSAIRIGDGCRVLLPSDTPADVPSKKNRVPIVTTLLIILRSGDSPGKHTIALHLNRPDDTQEVKPTQEITLSDPPHGGTNIKTTFGFMAYMSGLYLVDVVLDGKVITRMPFNVDIRRMADDEKPPAASRVQILPVPKKDKGKK